MHLEGREVVEEEDARELLHGRRRGLKVLRDAELVGLDPAVLGGAVGRRDHLEEVLVLALDGHAALRRGRHLHVVQRIVHSLPKGET